MSALITETLTPYKIVSQLPPDTVVTFHGVSWEEYEQLLERVGEASGLRLSYDDGTLQAMTLSYEHENYACFLDKLITVINLRLRINIRSFGSATMKKRRVRKGNEPDACYYVQSASLIGNRMDIDINTDPPPDIAVEIDVHHDSRSKLSIYASLGVPEVWRYNGARVEFYRLVEEGYAVIPASDLFPFLMPAALVEYLRLGSAQGINTMRRAFRVWVQAHKPSQD